MVNNKENSGLTKRDFETTEEEVIHNINGFDKDIFSEEYLNTLAEAYQEDFESYDMDNKEGNDVEYSEYIDTLLSKILKEVSNLVEEVISETDCMILRINDSENENSKEPGNEKCDKETRNRIIQNNGIIKTYNNYVRNTVDILSDGDTTKDKKLEKLEDNVYGISVLLKERGKICALHNLYGELEEFVYGNSNKNVEDSGF